MEALMTHLSGLAVAVLLLRVARYSSAFSSLASALAVLQLFLCGSGGTVLSVVCLVLDRRNVIGRRRGNSLRLLAAQETVIAAAVVLRG